MSFEGHPKSSHQNFKATVSLVKTGWNMKVCCICQIILRLRASSLDFTNLLSLSAHFGTSVSQNEYATGVEW